MAVQVEQAVEQAVERTPGVGEAGTKVSLLVHGAVLKSGGTESFFRD